MSPSDGISYQVGNVSSLVADVEPPKTINCDQPPKFYYSAIGSTQINWTEPDFVDNSQDIINVTRSHDFGIFQLGTTEIKYVAQDASGNVATCILNITVLGKLSCCTKLRR